MTDEIRTCRHQYQDDRGTCNREVTNGSECCFWHLKKDMKNVAEMLIKERPPREAFLAGANLREADLRRVNLEAANLERTDLSYSDLREAILVGANLTAADLERADLSYSDLHNARLVRTNLHRANLSHANLGGADLYNSEIANVVGLWSARLDRIEKNERDADSYLRMKPRTHARYHFAMDRYLRAKTINSDLKTYFRNEGRHAESGNHFIREQAIEAKRLWIASRFRKETDIRWHYPEHSYKDSKTFRWLYFLETKAKWVVNRVFYHVAGYGESPLRVVSTYVLMILLFAVLYWATGALDGRNAGPYSVWEYIYASAVTITTLGFGNQQPVLAMHRFLAAFEACLGSFLLAFFVVVVSRRMMR